MKVDFEDDDLTPLIERVVSRVLSQREAESEQVGHRLAYPEAEAAALLSMKPHVLRDARLRGEVVASRIGKRVFYSRDALLKLLAKNQIDGR